MPQADVLNMLLKYPQVMGVVIANTYGPVWLMGGAVISYLTKKHDDPGFREPFDYWNMYSRGNVPYKDFDILASEISGKFWIPRDWNKETNTFGGLKLRGPNIVMDLWKLRKHEPCRRYGLEFTIENVLALAPFTTMAVAVHLQTEEVLGEEGIEAIRSKTVAVNHPEEAQRYCRVYGTTLETEIVRRAKKLGFAPILS